jgi:hypothetical protein
MFRPRCLLAALFLLALPMKSQETDQFAADLARLHSLSRELAAMEVQMFGLNQATQVKPRGYFTADENDAIVSLLFRYLVCRDSLWEMVATYRDAPNTDATPDQRARAFVLGLNAALKLYHYSGKMVLTYLDEPAVIAKLNEAQPAYDIPRGTYDRLLQGLTRPENLRDLDVSWQVFVEEAGNPTTALYRLSTTDPNYRDLIAENYRFRASSREQIEAILKAQAIILPELANWMRQTEVARAARMSWRLVDDTLYTAKGKLFENVGHIRAPMAGEVSLTPEQIQLVRSQLQPGDIILTYSSGYMSNIFLPGKFKHGIVYVGSPADRLRVGLSPVAFATFPDSKRQKAELDVTRARLASGEPAELIEGVSEGVIFNSLDRILAGQVYRLVVLRPRLSPTERVDVLAKVFALLGTEYDFGFDFDNATYLCCTEVIYRAMHGKAGISFPLCKRLGIPTLSADDIIVYASGDGANCFEPILFVDTRGRFRKRAEILTGPPAGKRLADVMALPAE